MAMATRTSSPSASRSSSSRSGTSRSQTRRSSSTTKSKSKKKGSRSPSSTKRRPGVVTRLVTGIGHGLAAVWLGLAHLVGAIVRRLGHTARELDPEHRRDGLGFALIGLAIVVGATEWSRLPGPVGNGIRSVTEGSIGIGAYALPLLLVLGGVVVMRKPRE